MIEEDLPGRLAGSDVALCLSLDRLALPETSPAYRPPPPGEARQHLEIYFLERTPDVAWTDAFADLGREQAAAGVGDVVFVAGFLPTVPGTDQLVDAVRG